MKPSPTTKKTDPTPRRRALPGLDDRQLAAARGGGGLMSLLNTSAACDGVLFVE